MPDSTSDLDRLRDFYCATCRVVAPTNELRIALGTVGSQDSSGVLRSPTFHGLRTVEIEDLFGRRPLTPSDLDSINAARDQLLAAIDSLSEYITGFAEYDSQHTDWMFQTYTLEFSGTDDVLAAEPSWPSSIPEHADAMNVIRCIASLQKADEFFLRDQNHVAYYYKVVEQLPKLFTALERLNHSIESLEDGDDDDDDAAQGLVDVGYLDIKLDKASRIAIRGYNDADFGNYKQSWDVFVELCRGKGQVIPSSRLLTAGWGKEALVSYPNLYKEVTSIRKFINHLQLEIVSVRRSGYKLIDAS